MSTASAAPVALSERVSIRVGASVISNVLRLGLSFAAGLLVARGLGPAQYGHYQFLIATAASLSQFIDFGTSQAFFTFIARARRPRRFLVIYAAWLALQFIVVVAAIGVLAPRALIAAIWVGEPRTAILLAFAATFLMNEVWEAVSQLGEARRRTVRVQAALTVQAAAHVALIGTAVYLQKLTVSAAFVFVLLEYGLLVVLIGPALVRENVADDASAEPTVRTVCREFWVYCKPLVVYGVCGFLFMFIDRWLLQRFGGATEQGYFGIGQQFSTISLLATTSLVQVFWTEVAAAGAIHDRGRIVALFRSTSRAVYFVAAWITCLLIPYVREILAVTVGSSYTGAATAFALMLLYPIHQSIGRICGSLLQALGETGLYSRVGVLVMALSVPITYALIAPADLALRGLGLGAVGLALKTVIVNVLSVNLLAYAIASRLGAPFDWKHQLATMGLLLLLAFGCRQLAQQLVAPVASGTGLTAVLLGAGSYVAASSVLVYRRPDVIGLSRPQVASIVNAYRGVLASR